MSDILFTLITPTLQRDSLQMCCDMISAQDYTLWQHIVMVDCADLNQPAIDSIAHPRRQIIQCLRPHRDGGNTCRHNAELLATGDYVLYADDDNFIPSIHTLGSIAHSLEQANRPPWAIFPIHRLGHRFFSDPPRNCHIDTMNLVLRRDYAHWPQTDAYGSDCILVDDLMAREVPYAAFPDHPAIGVIPKISFCQ